MSLNQPVSHYYEECRYFTWLQYALVHNKMVELIKANTIRRLII